MFKKSRAKAKKILYDLKENTKMLDSGFIIENENTTIIDLIHTGFSKMEYFHILETKYSISTYLEAETEEISLAQKRAYAEFYLYITLIGYLDNKLNSLSKSHESLVAENNDFQVFLAGQIVSTTNFRNRVLEDYLSKIYIQEEAFKKASELDTITTFEEFSKQNDLANSNEVYSFITKMLLSKTPICENLSELIAMASSNDEQNFIISGFIQAYLEGFKKADEIDIDEIVSFYEKRQKEYSKYKDKCRKDEEEVKEILQKKNKSLL